MKKPKASWGKSPKRDLKSRKGNISGGAPNIGTTIPKNKDWGKTKRKNP